MAHGTHPGGLLHDNDLLIEMAHDNLLGPAGPGSRARTQFEDVAFLEPARGVEAQLTLDQDAARGNEGADLVPRLARQMRSQDGGQGGPCVVGGNSKGSKRIHETIVRSGDGRSSHCIPEVMTGMAVLLRPPQMKMSHSSPRKVDPAAMGPKRYPMAAGSR